MKTRVGEMAMLACLAASHAVGATNWWTGASGTSWTDAGNWLGSVPAVTDTAVFGGSVVRQPDIGTSAEIRCLDIESAGWVFSSDDGSGGLGNLRFNPADNNDAPKELNVTGPGLSVIRANCVGVIGYRGPDLYVGTGSKLVIDGNVVDPTGRAWTMSGTGFLVFNGTTPGTMTPPSGTGNSGSYLFNGPSGFAPLGAVNRGETVRIGDGQILGGCVPEFRVFQYGTLYIDAGGTLAPGGDGSTVEADGYDGGERISTLTLRSSSTTLRAGVSMASGSRLEMDIGDSPESHDRIVIGYLTSDLYLNGCELALRGSGFHEDGDYVLIQETLDGSDRVGTFGTITYNGEAVDPGTFSLTHTTGTEGAVVLKVQGLGKPKATVVVVE